MNFEYAFELKLVNNDYYELSFPDIPALKIMGLTPDKVFVQAKKQLDDYLYKSLRDGKKIPVAKTQASLDKRLSPSEAIKMALEFHLT